VSTTIDNGQATAGRSWQGYHTSQVTQTTGFRPGFVGLRPERRSRSLDPLASLMTHFDDRSMGKFGIQVPATIHFVASRTTLPFGQEVMATTFE